jgi:hypothetical protein
LAFAQAELGIGFKAGLNFSAIDGPLETDAGGMVLETSENNTGFQIGISAALAFTDLFGLKGELLYSQKGGNYTYLGPSFYTFYAPNGERLFGLGTRDIGYDVNNAYLDLPLMAYVRIGRLELSGGVNAAFLIASTASGGVTFTGTLPDGTPLNSLDIALDYNFLSSEFGVAAIIEARNVVTSGLAYQEPSVIDAYYENGQTDEKRFNRFDFGLNADVAYFLNSGLYASIRLNYGLSDVTNTQQDIAQTARNNDGSYMLREDKDRNISLQTTLGFRF